MSIASWMCEELGGCFDDFSDGEGGVITAHDRFMSQVTGDEAWVKPSDKAVPPDTRRVLWVSMEGMFDFHDDPVMGIARDALRSRGHHMLRPSPWELLSEDEGSVAAAELARADVAVIVGEGGVKTLTRESVGGCALRGWVAAGGTLVLHQLEPGAGPSLARLFDLPWVPCSVSATSDYTRNAGAQYAGVFQGLPDKINLRGAQCSGVPPRDALFTAPSGLTPFACGAFGAGRVAFLGDREWEAPTISALDALVKTSQKVGRRGAEGAPGGGGGSSSGALTAVGAAVAVAAAPAAAAAAPAAIAAAAAAAAAPAAAAPAAATASAADAPLGGRPKHFYGVRVGRVPGVYDCPENAREQCKGVSGALMQGFRSRAEARAFVADGAAAAAAGGGPRGGNFRYYAVRVGVVPGVYASNAEAQAQVVRVPGALYKGFTTLADAEAFVAGGRSVAATGGVKRGREDGGGGGGRGKGRR